MNTGHRGGASVAERALGGRGEFGARDPPPAYTIPTLPSIRRCSFLYSQARAPSLDDIGPRASFQLVPLSKPKPRPTFGSAEGEIWMSDDFDPPLDDFEEYMPS